MRCKGQATYYYMLLQDLTPSALSNKAASVPVALP